MIFIPTGFNRLDARTEAADAFIEKVKEQATY
jgi:hypothetical protein